MSEKPELEVRHMRTHVSHEGAQYIVYEKQRSYASYNERQYWKTFEHVIEDSGKFYAGAELRIPRERVVLFTEIKKDEYDRAFAQSKS